VGPTDSRWLYTTQQFGDHHRVDQRLRARTRIAPARAKGEPPLRFNWVAPIRLSPHNPQIVYAGAQVLFRSLDRGDHWQEISPDLTTDDQAKIALNGPSIRFCTITTLSESPLVPGVIWVGTDDGKVQLTRNHGATWTDLTARLAAAGAPADAWVTRVVASASQPGVAYVSKSRHRQDDFRPFLLRTADFGETWQTITTGLPPRPVNVVVEDPGKPALLFAGTDAGLYVSIDTGARWVHLKGNMPAVPVHDLVVHPREGDLVAGTYGRGLWQADIAWLREIDDAVLAADAHFFAIEPKARRNEGAWGAYELYGDRHLATPNEPNGLVLTYHVRAKALAKARIRVTDAGGREVRVLEGPAEAGLNRVVWDLRDEKQQPVPHGRYTATLEVAGRTLTQPAVVLL
jgi:hypothetical protein